jgi:hypothetical protein
MVIMMIKNVPMNPVPHDIIADIDPSAMTLYRSTNTKKNSLPKMDTQRLKSLELADFDKFIMLLLATVSIVSNPQIKDILTCVPTATSPIGFEGMMSDLMGRYGVAFNIKNVVGRLHNKDAAYKAMNRLARKGIVRTVQHGGNVRIRAELAGKGLETGWMLTKLGAAALLALTIKQGLPVVRDDEGKVIQNPNLTVADIKFNANGNTIGLDTQIHDLGVSAYLTGLMVCAAYYCNRNPKPINVDVCQVVGDGHDWEVNGTKMSRPDLSVVVFIRSMFIPLFLEWNNRTTPATIKKKANAHMRLMIEGTNAWQAGRPWLILTCPTEGKNGKVVKSCEKAIRDAARERGLLNTRTYDAMDYAAIAVVTHTDLGALSPYGAVYRIFDYKSGKLTDEKFTLASLKRASKSVEVPVEVEPSHKEPTPDKSCPREWWELKRGASAPLVGYVDAGGSSAALIGYVPEEVA